jgi:chemotaxis protein MotC
MKALAVLLLLVTPSFGADHEASVEAKADAKLEVHAPKIEPLEVMPIIGISRNLRALQLVQDRMVTGNIKAVDAQRALLEQMLVNLETNEGGAGITEGDVAKLLPMALLNGADPERVRSILGQSGIMSKDPFLLGALAYAEGRLSEGIAAFEKVDVAGLSPLARAQFHLTFGVMQAEIEPLKAAKHFAEARLAAPGTLIEEAALRRQALMVIAEPKQFLPLVKSYLHRFAASPFASAFISQFAFSIGDLDMPVQNEITKQLDGLLANAASQDRQNFYAILARSSLVGSNHELADFATARAVNEIKDPSQLLSARLYRAAFDIAGDSHAAAATELQSLMRVPLQASDREILAAAISVAQELRRWPFEEHAGKSNSFLPAAIEANTVTTGEETAGIAGAKKLLDDTAEITGAGL